MERDQYMQKEGDMRRDLEEKEGSVESFDKDLQHAPGGESNGESHVSQGTMGDSRPDQTDPEGTHFVDASDDPNLRISRRTSELTEPERGLAEEMDATRHDDSSIIAKPQGPLLEEGAELRPRQEKGEDS